MLLVRLCSRPGLAQPADNSRFFCPRDRIRYCSLERGTCLYLARCHCSALILHPLILVGRAVREPSMDRDWSYDPWDLPSLTFGTSHWPPLGRKFNPRKANFHEVPGIYCRTRLVGGVSKQPWVTWHSISSSRIFLPHSSDPIFNCPHRLLQGL